LSKHLVYVITEDWFFASHFLDRAIAAKNSGYKVSVVTRCRETAQRLNAHGLIFEDINFSRRGLNPISELATIVRLRAILRRINPDFVHNIALKPVVLGSLAARLAGVRNVVNAPVGMGYVFTSNESRARVLRPLVKKLIRYVLSRPNSKVIIENSDDYNNLVSGRFAKKESISLVKGAGVDTAKFKYTVEPEQPVKIIMVARLLRDKGIQEFIDVAEVVKQSNPSVKFLLVGDVDDGNPTSLNTKQLVELKNSQNVEWLGARHDIAELLAASHIACLPSYREGLPKSLIEAAAVGRAIVATDVPGCREVVTHLMNGLLVPPRDSKALAAALLVLINDPELRSKMGRENRSKAETEFANEIIIRQTQSVYDSFGQ
jgi:glycosyltransferase involved in cell wall biosynthesis